MRTPFTVAFAIASLLVTFGKNEAAESWTRTPLTVPASGKTGFTRMGVEQTGLTFTNRITEQHISENRLLEDGAGVAAGDYDGDGLCDLYFCNMEGPNALYRNLGGWRFQEIAAAAGVADLGAFCTGAVFADVNGDGRLDLLVNALGRGTRCFLNDGQGHFLESKNSGLIQRFGSRSMALADIDGDGDLDLYVTNYRSTTVRDSPVAMRIKQVGGKWEVPPEHRDRFIAEPSVQGTVALLEWGEADLLYLNDGHGHFEPVKFTEGRFLDEDGKPLATPPLDWGLTAMFRDLNGDGRPDLYVCNDFFTPDRIWINQGKGVFRAIPRLALRKTCYAAMSVDFGDLNRDGFDEMFVTEMLSRDHTRRHVQHSLLEMAALPMWGWGWEGRELAARVQVMRNTLSLNRGDGTFAEIAQFSGVEASEWTWGVAFCDVDLDGYEDILIANGHGRDLANSDALAAMDRLPKATEPQERLKTLHLFGPLKLPHLLYRNRGDLTFEEVSHAWGFDVVGVANGMVLADLDNDGDLDVVMNNLNEPAVLLRNDSTAPRLAVRVVGERGNTQGIGANIRVLHGPVPQSQEVISGGRYLSGADPLRTFACGSSTQLTVKVSWPSGKESVVDGALPNSLYSIRESGATAAQGTEGKQPAVPLFEDRSQLLRHQDVDTPFDDFERQPLLPKRLSTLGPGIAWCDVNGDGQEDLAVGCGRGGVLRVFLNQGEGKLMPVEAPAWKTAASDDLTGLVGWSNESGSSTLLVGIANYERGDAKAPAVQRYDVFFGEVQASAAVPGTEESSGPLAVADIDGDGQLDLFVGGRVLPGRYPQAVSSRLFRSLQGKFVPDLENTGTLQRVGLVSGAVWTDLNGDGFPELVLACDAGPVRVFRNEHGVLKPMELALNWGQDKTPGRPQSIAQLRGWWTGVTAGDFDGDGRLDLAVGNWGLNNKYRAHLDHELRLFHGDADGNGSWDVLEAYWESGLQKVVPWRDWKAMQAAIPLVGERFKSYGDYGRASVEEILSDGFKNMEELRLNTLESLVLLNRGDHFAAQPLPMEAQLTPAFALCVADSDGDGKEDLFVSQNFFGTDLETGRHDAGRGLWLRGDGQGGFRPLSAAESGITIYGDQRGAGVADYDGDGRVDLAVCQHGAETKLFHNMGAKPGLRVRLTGSAGNGSGLGAVIRLGTNGQWGPAREIHGGSGYWSQDGAIQVMTSAAPATDLQVRWPGGQWTSAKIPPTAHELRVGMDGQVEVVR